MATIACIMLHWPYAGKHMDQLTKQSVCFKATTLKTNDHPLKLCAVSKQPLNMAVATPAQAPKIPGRELIAKVVEDSLGGLGPVWSSRLGVEMGFAWDDAAMVSFPA
ncbi:hypothetical protein ETB97_004551 [Aspergillus alliaceus]|uniref:Uncharacterized protein n=1 Tax=Petromyces alliaceus TaxID=209559 RepID=A0A8H6AFC2_PETAA|nr:hypothetical protein ETB97_004551 [Aspergillus burnettii]